MSREIAAIRALYQKLLRAPRVKFPTAGKRLEASSKHGVYIIYSPRGAVLHVGRTVRGKNGLRQRLYNHIQGNSSFSIQFLSGRGSLLRGNHAYAVLEVASARTRALLEAYAVGSLCPKHLGLGESAAA